MRQDRIQPSNFIALLILKVLTLTDMGLKALEVLIAAAGISRNDLLYADIS